VNEFSKNIRPDYPDFVCGIMMGADAPMPPVAMSSAAPGGAPPRRIKKKIPGKDRFTTNLVQQFEALSQPGMPVRRGSEPQRSTSF